jgi:hypothetical protein
MLLLRPELDDDDIPHRTKLREIILNHWKCWFQMLKGQLHVSTVRFKTD